ncbi:DUF2304 domain-containing protein [Candidatus Woesearchaeota archaeon]|nr:DUF2304 domain-containing protein [Candidatus Woesearchaeota archaeon]
MVLPVQIGGAIFILVMLYLTFLFYKKDHYDRNVFAFWVFIWCIAFLMLSFPSLFTGLTESLDVARITDLYVSVALMFVMAVTFFNFLYVKRNERKLEAIVQKLALDRVKK